MKEKLRLAAVNFGLMPILLKLIAGALLTLAVLLPFTLLLPANSYSINGQEVSRSEFWSQAGVFVGGVWLFSVCFCPSESY